MQRQPEAGEPVEELERLLLAPVALVHVGLQPERVDRDAGLEAALDQALVVGGHVEVVEQQRRRRVGLARRLERQPDDRDPAELAGEPGDAVARPVEHRHDHDLVDHVPGVDQAGEVGDVAPDPRDLGRRDSSVGQVRAATARVTVCQQSGWPLTATPRSANQRAVARSRRGVRRAAPRLEPPQ